MDDRFLAAARRAPRPEFTASLRRRLAAVDEERRARAFTRARVLRSTLFALAPAAAAVALLVAFPEVRTAAQSFLELFRVRNFVAVQVDPERMKMLHEGNVDPLSLVGSRVTTSPAEEPRHFATPAEAFAAAGYAPHVPTYLPEGYAVDSAVVIGAHEGEITIEAKRLNEYLVSLGIRDVELPAGLDGARIGIKAPRAVVVRYERVKGDEHWRVRLIQTPHPEIALPAGLPRERLAEIGLRVLGLPADEARRFAARIDWTSSMLVPIPTGKATFREVEVRGRRAILIESAGSTNRNARMLLWSDAERVYSLGGELHEVAVMAMAESIP